MRRAALSVALCFFALPSLAQGAYEPQGAGTTELTLDKSFVSFLAKDGISLGASQGAKRKGNAYLLPVIAGSLDPTTGKGEIDSEGTLAFKAEGRKVPLREITVKTKHAPLSAKVGGSQLKVATSGKLSFKREGFGSAFGAKALKLSAKVATRLNKKLRPRIPFSSGQTIGSLLAKPQPKLITIEAIDRATMVFDPAFLAKLESHFVSLNPVFPAEHQGPSFSFPIAAGGALAPHGTEGTLRTAGTVELLQLGGGQVFWQELWVDLGAKAASAEVDLEPAPAFPGKIGRTGVFDVSGGSVSSDPSSRTISVSGLSLTLTAESASALNDAFAEGKALFGAGEGAGTLGFGGQGQ
jgi:hypothetical protein